MFWKKKRKAAPVALRELAPPPQCDDPGAVEVMRAFIVDNALHSVVRWRSADSAGIWGVVLCDVMRHVANAYAQAEGRDRAAVDGALAKARATHMSGGAGLASASDLTVTMEGEGALPPVAAARTSPEHTEILRVWTHDSTHVCLRWNVFGAPDPWGMIVADLQHHVARAYGLSGQDEEAVFDELGRVFEAEWIDPTDDPRGHVEA